MLERIERKDAAKHRELILQTANQLFHTQGVDKVQHARDREDCRNRTRNALSPIFLQGRACIELLMDSFVQFANGNDHYLTEAAERPVRERFETFLSTWIDYIAGKVHWLNAMKPSSLCPADHDKIYRSEPFMYVTGVIIRLLDEAISTDAMVSVNTKFAAYNIASSISLWNHFFFCMKVNI